MAKITFRTSLYCLLLQGHDMLARVLHGFQSLYHAVSLAPEVWIAMFIRVVSKQECRAFFVDLKSALLSHSSHKLPETFWLCFSRLLHKLDNNNNNNVKPWNGTSVWSLHSAKFHQSKFTFSFKGYLLKLL